MKHVVLWMQAVALCWAFAAAAQTPAADPAGVLKTGPIGQIVLARDPMLSPYDLVRIAEEEERKRQIAEQLKREAWLRAHPPKRQRVVRREPDPSTSVELQGIVSTDQGDKAIVNGEMVQEGDLVVVDVDGENARVKVVKISPTAVLFQYRKKRFMKGISKD